MAIIGMPASCAFLMVGPIAFGSVAVITIRSGFSVIAVSMRLIVVSIENFSSWVHLIFRQLSAAPCSAPRFTVAQTGSAVASGAELKGEGFLPAHPASP